MIPGERRAELLALATECRALVDCVMASSEKPVGPPSAQNLLKRAVAMLTAKACDTFDGLLLLAGHGLVGEAFVLYRVLLETFASTEFVVQHGDAGVFLFWEGTTDHLRKLRKILEQGHMKDHWTEADTHEGIRRLESECREIQGVLPGIFGGLPPHDVLWTKRSPRRRMTWEKIRISDRFDRAGLKSLYDTVYSFASQHVHSDPAIQRSYFESPGSEDPLVGPKVSLLRECGHLGLRRLSGTGWCLEQGLRCGYGEAGLLRFRAREGECRERTRAEEGCEETPSRLTPGRRWPSSAFLCVLRVSAVNAQPTFSLPSSPGILRSITSGVSP